MMRSGRKDIIKILLIVAVLSAFVLLTERIGRVQDREEARIVEDAVRRCAATCYAVEGAYPGDLDYLKENYHLSYDEEQFFVTYQSFASNLVPDIYVVERGAGGS